jgi:hypothetical protein
MLNHTKSPFWPLAGRRRADEADDQPAGVETSPDVSSRLGSLMEQIDAGIAQSMERERSIQAGRRRQFAAEPPAPKVELPQAAVSQVAALQAAALAGAAAADPAAKPEPPKPEPPKVEHGSISSIHVEAPEEPVEIDPATNEALRAIAEQRKAAEALLLETCVLEERIKNEAIAAKAARAYEAAAKQAESAAAKVKTIAVAEAEARQRAEGSLHDRSIIVGEMQSIEELLTAKRKDADAAKASIARLEQQLAEAQRAAESVFADVALHESRKRECGTREAAAARSAAEAAARAVARKAELEAAEAEAKTARERAEALKAQLVATEQKGAGEDVQRLAARIAQQVQLARTSHNGYLNGKKAS